MTLWLICLVLAFLCGDFHAVFIAAVYAKYNHGSWRWHLLQWVPIGVGALIFLYTGWYVALETFRHNWFGLAGLILSPMASAGVGYVVGWNAMTRYRNE